MAKGDHQLCLCVEFLALLVPHSALRYESRIHGFGASSTTIRGELGWIRKAQQAEATAVEAERARDLAAVRRSRGSGAESRREAPPRVRVLEGARGESAYM